jgi:hypothetical protein
VGGKYKRYAAVTLALTKGGAGTPTKALIDSGNEWRTVISDVLAARLGFRPKDLKKLSVSPVGTARKGTNLKDPRGNPNRPLHAVHGRPALAAPYDTTSRC